MRTWTFPELRPPGEGPWQDEPDKAQWTDDPTDLDCLIVRNRAGSLCGYVGVPPGHPWHGMPFQDVPTDVNGRELSFSGLCEEGAEDAPAVCHVPQPGRPADVWWIGFHCSYGMELSPRFDSELPEDLRALHRYRTFGYVQQQCADLAASVKMAEV